MTPPVHRRPGQFPERPFRAMGRGEPVAAESGDFFERMNRFLEEAGVVPAGGASPPADLHETDEAKAPPAGGVLTITMPKAQPVRPYHIEIAES